MVEEEEAVEEHDLANLLSVHTDEEPEEFCVSANKSLPPMKEAMCQIWNWMREAQLAATQTKQAAGTAGEWAKQAAQAGMADLKAVNKTAASAAEVDAEEVKALEVEHVDVAPVGGALIKLKANQMASAAMSGGERGRQASGENGCRGGACRRIGC